MGRTNKKNNDMTFGRPLPTYAKKKGIDFTFQAPQKSQVVNLMFKVRSVWVKLNMVGKTHVIVNEQTQLGHMTRALKDARIHKGPWVEKLTKIEVKGLSYSFERVTPQGNLKWHMLKNGRRILSDITSNRVAQLVVYLEKCALAGEKKTDKDIEEWILLARS